MALAAQHSTYAEYLELEASSEQRYEFVDGMVYTMAGGTPEHSRLAIALASVFNFVANDRLTFKRRGSAKHHDQP